MLVRKNSLILYLKALLGLLFVLLIISIMENRKPLKNVKYEGGLAVIDISDGVTDEHLKKEMLFVVPEAFNPQAYNTGFSFYMKYTDGSPYTGNEMPKPVDEVFVSVFSVKDPDQMSSINSLKRIQPNNGPMKNVPYFVERKNGVDIYRYDYGQNDVTLGTIYSFNTESGDIVIVEDPGDWSRNFRVTRKFIGNIELKYQFSKKQIQDQKTFIADVVRIDNSVLNTVKSFRN